IGFHKDLYGPLQLNQSQSRPRKERVLISSLSRHIGETVLLHTGIQTSQAKSNQMVFLNLHQRTDSVQALLIVTPEKISKQMVKWAAGLADKSIILVDGVVQKSSKPIKSTSVDDLELHLASV
ncbi:hypothetical protein C8J56DRAFT_766893, partial [Mycena floridula]